MHIPFSQLPASSKVWIYQADKKFSSQDEEIITDYLSTFTQQWMVHGTPLEASFEIKFHQFVILAANDNASGCSIDSSVRIFKEIGSKTGIDFFNRNMIAFKEDETITLIPLKGLKSTLNEGVWKESSVFFNNAVSSLDEFHTNWLTAAGKTWLKRYFVNETLSNNT
jgi:hypothetical protein